MRRKKSVLWVVLSNIGGFLLFLVMLALADIFLGNSSNKSVIAVLSFLNSNLGLIIAFSIFFFIAELFYVLFLPFNLPYPLFNAVGGFLLVIFLFRLFLMIQGVTGADLYPLISLRYFFAVLVFFIVLIVGFVKVFIPTPRYRKTRRPKEKAGREHADPGWHDIGDEFRGMIMDIIKSIRDSVKGKK